MSDTSALSNPGAFLVRTVDAPQPAGDAPAPQPQEETSGRYEGLTDHIDGYEGQRGRPYIVDLLDILPVYQQLGMTDQMKSIDRHILAEMKSRNLQPTKVVYEDMFAELRQNLNLDPRLNFDEVVDRVDAYVGMLNMVNQKKLMKQVLGLG